MSERKVWFVTRPERDPQFHPDAMKALAIATNNFTVVWQGNREAHKQFEMTLAQMNLKRNNISNDGSGGRTWCAMLKTFAYCYINQDGYVKPTKVGKALIGGENVYKNVKKQILTLQIPNAYFLEAGFKPKYSPNFRIRPARFLIKAVHSHELDFYVTKEEITYFVLTAQTDSELPKIIEKIVKFRNSTTEEQNLMKQEIAVEYDHRARNDHAARDYFQAHSDVAHTFMMLCEYTGFVEYVRGDAILKIDPLLVGEAKKLLEEYDLRYPFNTRYLISLERMAQNNGLDVDSYKASDFGDVKPATNALKLKNKVENILKNIPNVSELSKEELKSFLEGEIGPNKLDEILDELILNKPVINYVPPEFVEKYLGELTPAEFEKETVKILEAIGFDVTYQPKIEGRATEIEIYLKYKNISGIIDTKYYTSKFTLNQSLANYMASEYINNYLKYNNQELSFYGYITSEKYTGEKKLHSITELAKKLTGKHIEGFLMQRDVLIGFLDYCLENNLSVDERIELFVSKINNSGITHF